MICSVRSVKFAGKLAADAGSATVVASWLGEFQLEAHGQSDLGPIVSVVVPAFNEEDNVLVFYERLQSCLDRENDRWELIVVDDHSGDRTYERTATLIERDKRVRVIRLSRNAGSHIAAMCGLEHCSGSAAVVMAVDLQDPPERILDLVRQWQAGYQVVWAVRQIYQGRNVTERLTSKIYHKLMNRIVGQNQAGPKGADFFLIDRAVVDSTTRFRERNLSLFAIVAWLGFRQTSVLYVKERRERGRSGWTLRKKLKLFVDSITAFSFAPIRMMSLTGLFIALLGFVYALTVVINYFLSVPQEGWSSLTFIVLVLGGMQITMLGVLGEYLWRSLDEARQRPRYNIENMQGVAREGDELSPREPFLSSQAG